MEGIRLNCPRNESIRENFLGIAPTRIILFSVWFKHSSCWHRLPRAFQSRAPQALCTGVVKAYKAQDLDAFCDLAVGYADLKDMMSKVKVPASAKRESLSKMGANGYKKMVQDSLQTILKTSPIEWPKASFEKFEPSRNPVEIATGYKMLLGKMHIQQGELHFVQAITIVEAGKNKYFMGDFSPIEPLK